MSLRLHCGLGVGIINVFVVGADERWELVIAGDPIRQLAETEGEADRGQVVVSPEVQRLLSMGHVPYPVPLERTDGGNYQLRWAAEDDRPRDDRPASSDDAAPAEPEDGPASGRRSPARASSRIWSTTASTRAGGTRLWSTWSRSPRRRARTRGATTRPF